MMMRRGRAREPSLPCCDDPGVVVYSPFFSVCQGSLAGEKGGLGQYMNEAMALWAFVCVCVRVCGISIFLLSSIHHVSCCSMQKEKKGR